MQSWTWPRVWQRRLERHWLLAPAPADRMLDVVGDVCGIHAQVAASAELSLALRTQGTTRHTLRAALWQERTLVKTYGLRGTLHVFPSRELAFWLAALRAKPSPRESNRAEFSALPADQRDRLTLVIHDALDGDPLTRDELEQEVERRAGAWATEAVFPAFTGHWPRWQLALRQAAVEGLIVFGPNRGNRVTYARADQWLGPLVEVDGEQALREVCLRFLAAYGPATHVEFGRWFYMRPAAALELMRSLDLEEVDVEGWRAWLPRDDVSPPTRLADSVLLLPYYDCYVVGCHPRAQLIPAIAPPEMQKGTAAPFAVAVIDGVVGGLWTRQRRGNVLEIRVHTFEALSREQTECVERQAARVGEILEMPATVSYGQVEARGHL